MLVYCIPYSTFYMRVCVCVRVDFNVLKSRHHRLIDFRKLLLAANEIRTNPCREFVRSYSNMSPASRIRIPVLCVFPSSCYKSYALRIWCISSIDRHAYIHAHFQFVCPYKLGIRISDNVCSVAGRVRWRQRQRAVVHSGKLPSTGEFDSTHTYEQCTFAENFQHWHTLCVMKKNERSKSTIWFIYECNVQRHSVFELASCNRTNERFAVSAKTATDNEKIEAKTKKWSINALLFGRRDGASNTLYVQMTATPIAHGS